MYKNNTNKSNLDLVTAKAVYVGISDVSHLVLAAFSPALLERFVHKNVLLLFVLFLYIMKKYVS